MGLAEDGTILYDTKNIEDIQVGDLVYSYNTQTGETDLAEVTATFALTSDHINYLTIIDENGDEQVIETTDAHPFWVVTDEPDFDRAARSIVDENGVLLYHENLEPGLNGFWVEAKDLQIGDVFLGANGELSTLVATDRSSESIAVFNITVEGNHNYFILAKEYEYGQSCILVHNAKCGGVDTDDQRALRELINETTNGARKPLTVDQAETILDWATEVELPGARALLSDVTGNHPGKFMDGKPHIHMPGVGKDGHILVAPGVKPRPFPLF